MNIATIIVRPLRLWTFMGKYPIMNGSPLLLESRNDQYEATAQHIMLLDDNNHHRRGRAAFAVWRFAERSGMPRRPVIQIIWKCPAVEHSPRCPKARLPLQLCNFRPFWQKLLVELCKIKCWSVSARGEDEYGWVEANFKFNGVKKMSALNIDNYTCFFFFDM